MSGVEDASSSEPDRLSDERSPDTKATMPPIALVVITARSHSAPNAIACSEVIRPGAEATKKVWYDFSRTPRPFQLIGRLLAMFTKGTTTKRVVSGIETPKPLAITA